MIGVFSSTITTTQLHSAPFYCICACYSTAYPQLTISCNVSMIVYYSRVFAGNFLVATKHSFVLFHQRWGQQFTHWMHDEVANRSLSLPLQVICTENMWLVHRAICEQRRHTTANKHRRRHTRTGIPARRDSMLTVLPTSHHVWDAAFQMGSAEYQISRRNGTTVDIAISRTSQTSSM